MITFIRRFWTLELELPLLVGVPVFAGYVSVASIGHWINLFHEDEKNSKVKNQNI
jgi:hypothetical protein